MKGLVHDLEPKRQIVAAKPSPPLFRANAQKEGVRNVIITRYARK